MHPRLSLPDLVALRLRRRAAQRKYTRAARLQRAPSQPHAQELAYTRALVDVLRPVQQLVRDEIFPLLGEIAGRQDVLYGRIANRFSYVVQESIRLVAPPKIIPVIDTQAVRLDKFNKAQIRKQLGLDFSRDTHVQLRLQQFRDRNVQLIQSLPQEMIGQVGDVMLDAQARGLRVEEIQESIEQRFDVSDSRAALIARDQTLKTNADLSQARMQDAGIAEYVWTTAGDERVRPLHRQLDGSTQNWLTPPVTNDRGDRNAPGKDFQCRCWPDPIIPGD